MNLTLTEIRPKSDEFTVVLVAEGRHRDRRITVRLSGERLIDVQADDGRHVWAGNAGDERLTKLAIDRAREEAARLRAIELMFRRFGR